MTSSLDTMIDAVRASEARLPDDARAAILARVLAEVGERPAVAAVVPLAPRRRRRDLAAAAVVIALAAAAVIAIGWRGDEAPGDAPAGVPPAPPSPPGPIAVVPAAPLRLIPPQALAALQIAGSLQIEPDEGTMKGIKRAGRDELAAAFQICIDPTGAPSSVRLLASSGFYMIDAQVLSKAWGWRYRPYVLGGGPVAVCSVVQFRFDLR